MAGISAESLEKAADSAVETAAKNLKNLRIAEVLKQDVHIEKDKLGANRVKIKLSFKYQAN